jgi:lipase chaperone LimK
MKRKTGLLLLSFSAAVLLGVRLLQDATPADTDADTALAAAPSADMVAHVPPAHFTTGLENLPRSLHDTEVDGELAVDERGRLKITSRLRNVFDYFLSATGEEPVETLLKRLRAYIRHKLPAGAAAEAERILDGYVAYKKSLTVLQAATPAASGGFDIAALRRQMQQVPALRLQHLAPEVIDAFFGNEDAYDNYSLARLELLQDKQLTPQARAQQLAALEQQLPPDLQASLRIVSRYQNLEALTADWKERKGNPAELRQIRENLVGTEAAERLEALDRERAVWDQRMKSWFGQRDAILGNRNLADTDRQDQLETLRRQRFAPGELARVQALERIHDQG